MTNGKEPSKPNPIDDSSDSEKSKSLVRGTYESVVQQAVAKIRNEPFLFVIALAALLVGFTTLATRLGSPDLRFIVVVIAFLAFTVILGYYLLATLQMRSKTSAERSAKRTTVPPESSSTGDGKPAARSSDQGKYVVTASNSQGVTIGDGAKVEQHFGNKND